MQRRGIEMTELFDVENVGTSEIETSAIIGYAAIHEGLTNEMVENYTDYPSREEMATWLEEHNIGYDPMKKKKYDWHKRITHKKKDIEKAYLACQLSKNVGDISKVNKFPKCDLLTFSYPCTDLSLAGKQLGMIKGETRSGLVYEVLRILQNMEDKPTFLLMENVDALVNKKNKPKYEELNEEFAELGYDVKWEILNGKECGVPQSRRRIFAIYWLRDKVDLSDFTFPTPFDNGLRLKDILLKNVDEKYYINNDRAKKLIEDLVMNGKIVPDERERERERERE